MWSLPVSDYGRVESCSVAFLGGQGSVWSVSYYCACSPCAFMDQVTGAFSEG